jgi:hypothetical protein
MVIAGRVNAGAAAAGAGEDGVDGAPSVGVSPPSLTALR